MTNSVFVGLLEGMRNAWSADSNASMSTRWMRVMYRMVAMIGYHIGTHHPVLPRHLESGSASSAKSVASNAALRPNHHADGKMTAVVLPVYASSAHKCTQVIRAVSSVIKDQIRDPDVVIVVDDASPQQQTSWKSTIQSIAEDYQCPLEIIELTQNGGPANARNVGMERAMTLGCDVVCFMDADCVAQREWINNMVRGQLEGKGGVLGGITVALDEGISGVGDYHNFSGTLNGRALDGDDLLYACTCNMSIRLDVIKDLRFDATFPNAAYEDVDFCLKARAAGVPVQALPDALMMHDFDTTTRGLFQEFSRYGGSEHLLLEKHPQYLRLFGASSSIQAQQYRNTVRNASRVLRPVTRVLF